MVYLPLMSSVEEPSGRDMFACKLSGCDSLRREMVVVVLIRGIKRDSAATGAIRRTCMNCGVPTDDAADELRHGLISVLLQTYEPVWI